MAVDPSHAEGSPGAGYAGFFSSLLSNRDQFFAEIVESRELGEKSRHALVVLLAFTGIYGLAAGAYSGLLQAVSSAIKLPFLFIISLAICFPAFFVVQILLGSKLRLSQMVVLVISSLSLSGTLLAAFVPIVIFFLITGSNYYFLQLLHIVLVLSAGLCGVFVLHEGLSFVCEKHGIYPRKAMRIMRIWAVLLVFVGIQMAWNLRPFLGDRDTPFQVFRKYEGNFYTAIVYSFQQLADRKQEEAHDSPPRTRFHYSDLWKDESDSSTGERNR